MTTKLFRNDIKVGTPLRLVSNDVNGKLSELVYHLNADNSWATANDAENLRMVTQYAIKQYVATQVSQIGSITEWLDSINAFAILENDTVSDFTSWESGITKNIGDRYCVAVGGQAIPPVNENKVIEWNGTSWDKTTAVTGMCFILDQTPEDYIGDAFKIYIFNGYNWIEKTFGINYTGGNGISIVGSEVSIKILTSNSGLTLTASGISLKANTSNFKIDDANGLGFKNGTAVGQVWYWNGSDWVADTVSNLVNFKYKTNVDFSGTKNGTNKIFVVNNGSGAIVESSLTVYKNGMRMDKTIDYTYVNATKTLTFTTDTNAPESDAILVCDLFEV